MKKISKEEVLKLKEGTKYIVYNPLTDIRRIEIAGKKDIAHNKNAYDKLEYYLLKDAEDGKHADFIFIEEGN